jgi:anti-sigma B factor antagonist
MKYSIERKEEYAVLTLEEENLNSVKAPDLKSEFFMLKSMGVKNIILNLEKVKYVDSSGLSAILTGNRLWEEDNKAFVLVNLVHPSVKMLITISRLDSILTIAPSLQEAEKTVMMHALADEVAGDGEDEDGDVADEE